MKQNYCTLFDSKYLSRGLALYFSLEEYSKDFKLYIFAFDNKAYESLKNLNLTYATIISLKEFEDEELLKVKPTRNIQEYCWTCTSSIIKFSLEKFHLDSCTYLDADLLFFSDPSPLHNELGDKSVLITEHRFTEGFNYSKDTGKYCVQFLTFKNNSKGMEVLNWWRNACIDWCYDRYENGKFGDQKYLDDWMIRFDCVVELQNLGGGVAPWNIQQYDITTESDLVKLRHVATNKIMPLVFYHFHDFKILNDKGTWGHSTGVLSYRIGVDAYHAIYKHYLMELHFLEVKYGKNLCKTDFPCLPDMLTVEEFDGMILPRLEILNERDLLRRIYKMNEEFIYSLDTPALNIIGMEVIFPIFLKSDFHLNRYESGFHAMLSKFGIHNEDELNGTLSFLEAQRQITSYRGAYSCLSIAENYSLDWGRSIYSNLQDIKKEEFEIHFFFSEKTIIRNFSWMPMVNLYCSVQLLQVLDGQSSNNLQIKNLSHNGINTPDNYFNLIHLNGIVNVELEREISTNVIVLKGKWKVFEYWQLGERTRQVIKERDLKVQKFLKGNLISSLFSKASFIVFHPIKSIQILFGKLAIRRSKI